MLAAFARRPWLRHAALAGVVAAGVAPACAPSPRMCVSESDCGSQASCVAGRCVVHGATPAIATSRRMLVEPVEQGWVRRGDATSAGIATLGRGDDAVLFLRFSVPLPPEVTLLEGYVLMQRAPAVDGDPGTIALHAARIEGTWDARSLSWGRQPSWVEVGAPITTVQVGISAQGTPVRVDVRGIVERWRRRERGEGGLAILTDGRSASGLPIVLEPTDVPTDREDVVLRPAEPSVAQASSPLDPPPVALHPRQVGGPRLELYVR